MPRQYTPRVSLTCCGCSKTFDVPPSHACRFRFCSTQCRASHSRWKDAPTGVTGIYAIVHVETGRAYVGSSSDIRARWYVHRGTLTRNASGSPALQAAWNQHGESAFEFRVLEVLEPGHDLTARESAWIEALRQSVGVFNAAPSASTAGMTRSDRFRHLASSAKIGAKNPMALLSDDQVRHIRERLAQGETGASIARAFVISASVVSQIKLGRWGTAGRRARGNGPSRTLPDSVVTEIRQELASGVLATEIAKRRGISASTVYRIRNGQTH